MSMPALVPRYTAAEIRSFPEQRVRYEVISGELFVTPAPGTPHQRAVRELCILLHGYLSTYGLGEVLPAPYEVEFDTDSAVQPDLIALLHRDGPQLTAERLHGHPPPALVVEVVSHASRRTDRLQKRRLYQEQGVPEYWVVDIEQRHVERWRPADAEPLVVTDTLAWQPQGEELPLEIDLRALFDVVAR